VFLFWVWVVGGVLWLLGGVGGVGGGGGPRKAKERFRYGSRNPMVDSEGGGGFSPFDLVTVAVRTGPARSVRSDPVGRADGQTVAVPG
jgi:hypothetical protein